MDCLLQDCLESQLGTGEMVQWAIVLTAKPAWVQVLDLRGRRREL